MQVMAEDIKNSGKSSITREITQNIRMFENIIMGTLRISLTIVLQNHFHTYELVQFLLTLECNYIIKDKTFTINYYKIVQ